MPAPAVSGCCAHARQPGRQSEPVPWCPPSARGNDHEPRGRVRLVLERHALPFRARVFLALERAEDRLTAVAQRVELEVAVVAADHEVTLVLHGNLLQSIQPLPKQPSAWS